MPTIHRKIAPSIGSDLGFQAWVRFVRDTFLAGGWQQTNDTGQLDIDDTEAWALPGGADTKVGYHIFAMSDKLQATDPVFVRIDYGSGAANWYPALWVTIGPATDGAGAIQSAIFTPGTQGTIRFASGDANMMHFCHGSASPSHVVFAFFPFFSQRHSFGIERGRNAAGEQDGDIVLFHYSQSSGVLNRTNCLHRTSGASQPPEQPIACAVVAPPGGHMNSEHESFGFIVPMDEINGALQPTNPGLNYIVKVSGPELASASLVVFMYGRAVRYRRIGDSNNFRPEIRVGAGANFTTYMRDE